MDYPDILLASGNGEKLGAFRTVLNGLPFNLITPAELGVAASTQECGDTHEAIALEKAVEWSKAGSMLAIASDGGLVIPALGHLRESRHTRRLV